MSKILLSIFAVGILVSVGQALQCYNCDFGVWNLCIKTKVTCKAGELCFSGVGTAISAVDIMTKGCLAVSNCNQTVTAPVPGFPNSTVYKLTKTCCTGDLCNAAPGLARLDALPLALLTLTSFLLTKHLV